MKQWFSKGETENHDKNTLKIEVKRSIHLKLKTEMKRQRQRIYKAEKKNHKNTHWHTSKKASTNKQIKIMLIYGLRLEPIRLKDYNSISLHVRLGNTDEYNSIFNQNQSTFTTWIYQ